ncbi:MAG: hypothetical protein AAF959_24730 [Cyanobacteria bacterium P01_D01_bin.56]
MFLIRGIARQITRTASGLSTPEVYLISKWRMLPVKVYQASFKFSDTFISDNLCFDLTKRRVSPNLLLQPPEIQSLLEPLATPEVKKNSSSIGIPETFLFAFSDFCIEKSRCSSNYLEQIKLPNIFEYPEFFSEVLSISKNLFRLLEAPKVDGKILIG